MSIIAPLVAPGYAFWLKSEALFVAASDNDIATRWGALALDTSIVSCIAGASDAVTEAVRQLALLGGPLARDEHVVSGLRHDLIGKRIRLRTYAKQPLGYGGARDGVAVLAIVIKAVESDSSDMTTLTVIRRLA